MKRLNIILIVVLFCFFQSCSESMPAYYVDASYSGAESNGSKERPWRTLAEIDESAITEGATIYLMSDLNESATLNSLKGTKENPIMITSFGDNKKTIFSKNEKGLEISNSQHIIVSNLKLEGSGRKEGNEYDGLLISNGRNISLEGIEAEGYQKSGVHIKSSVYVTVDGVYAHNNGFCGILVSGDHDNKTSSRNIVIKNSVAENNPGDPTNFTNHSGNGILVGSCTNVTIEYCSANNNGWDMPREGNGPVGIWAYEADSVLIQYCISYRNKTSEGGKDGGGFDFDGGVTNSIIQYCLSYENEGSGYGLFQYEGASPWYNNTVRYCISENDGNTSNGMGGIFVWNATGNPEDLRDCIIYNNTVYNSGGSAICYDIDSSNKNLYYYNNIFVGKDDLVKGVKSLPSNFIANNWYSIDNKGFNIGGIKDFKTWAKTYDKEYQDGKLVGLNIDPEFKNPGKTTLTDPQLLRKYDAYKLPEDSPLRKGGFDFTKKHEIKDEFVSLDGNLADKNLMGALQ